MNELLLNGVFLNGVFWSDAATISGAIFLGASGVKWCQQRRAAKRAMGLWPQRFEDLKAQEVKRKVKRKAVFGSVPKSGSVPK